MKIKIFWLIMACTLCTQAYSGEFAKQVKDSPEENIFWTQHKTSKKMKGVAGLVSVSGSEFEIKPSAVKKLIKAKKENIGVSVLLSGVKEKLLLIKQSPFSYETDGVHYAGIVKGDDQSVVSLSVYEGKVLGTISSNGHKYVIDTSGVLVNVLDTTDLQAPSIQDTVIEDVKVEVKANDAEFPSNANKPVKVYYDADYALFIRFASTKAALTQFIEANLASVSALFANDGITVTTFGIKVWDTQDPYSLLTDTNSQVLLNNYRQRAALVPGAHLMHLLTSRPGMGGIAGLSALCGPTPHAVSSIYTTFQSGAVVYDWNQNVITHEIGHNLSSHHTHYCDWTVGGKPNQALDGCFSPDGGCTRPWTTPPAGFKGTIMSYCHLSGQMDLRLGFGQQPRDKIKNFIAQAACLGGPSPDGAAPLVSITSPTANQTVVGEGPRRFINFTAFADDDVAVTRVDFILKGPAGNLNNLTFSDYSYPFGYVLGVRDYLGTASLVGNYTLQAKAYDASGKTTTTLPVPFRIEYAPIDSVAPVVAVVKPANGLVWTGGTLDVVFSATDNVGVKSVSAYGNNQSLGGFSGANFQRTLDYSWFPAGPLRVDMYAFDADGNFGKQTVNITLGGADVTKPTVSISSPLANSSVSGSVPVSAIATDNIAVTGVDFYANGALVGSDSVAPYTSTVSTLQIANGPMSLRVVAKDAAGNTGESTINVTVSNPVGQGLNIASFVVGQNKTVADATKRNWIDLTLTGLVGVPTFQGRAVVNTAWSTKAGADAVDQGGNVWRIFFFNANTNYEVKALCNSCTPKAEKIQAFRSLP